MNLRHVFDCTALRVAPQFVMLFPHPSFAREAPGVCAHLFVLHLTP